MITQKFADVYSDLLAKNAILNNDFPGFHEDYLVLHCLLKKYQPKSIFEVGTNMGKGTAIICNAVKTAKVYSLDLPTELAHISLQHPISEGKGDRVGHLCRFPFTQLRGDSMTFDFGKYPCQAYYIDGEHDYRHACHETKQAVKCKAKLIIWHDSDIPEVLKGIQDGLNKDYQLYRVIDTRVAYAVRKQKDLS